MRGKVEQVARYPWFSWVGESCVVFITPSLLVPNLAYLFERNNTETRRKD